MATPASALRAVKIAIKSGTWRTDPHLLKQIAKRGLALVDVLWALENGRRAVPHDMRPLNVDGESWRVYGKDADGRELGVGVELVRNSDGGLMIIITAFVKE
jgi:hypothetical protein